MRGIETPITKIRRQVFTEVAKVAFESENINDDIEAIPYRITPSDVPLYRDSIYRERAIAGERVRLAMGMSLRPESQPVHITSGLNESNISDKYYEPPLMQVIPSACAACDGYFRGRMGALQLRLHECTACLFLDTLQKGNQP